MHRDRTTTPSPPPSSTARRRLAGSVAATLLGATLAAGWPAAAQAVEVGDLTALQAALTGDCELDTTITVTGPINEPAQRLTAACDATLDLNGQHVQLLHVALNRGRDFTITDGSGGGRLTADARSSGVLAGIRTTDATLTIAGGTVTAFGSDGGGAGMGGSTGGAGGTVTITGGTVDATGGQYGAGIGGGNSNAGGLTTITGGTVTANGGTEAAGIGGGVGAPGGIIAITGGDVEATGGNFAAGLGGGRSSLGTSNGSGGTIDIGGTAHVIATGGTNLAAGIGGGNNGAGGTVTIGDTATVTATSGTRAAGIGGGLGGGGAVLTIADSADVTAIGSLDRGSAVGPGDTSNQFGSLTLDGVLRVPTGVLRVPDSDADGPEITIGSSGQLVGGVGTETTGAQITGAGQIDNGGSIALTADLVQVDDVSVAVHHFDVTFDTQGADSATPDPVLVFASSFDRGYRAFPPDPTAGELFFTGWNSAADGSGVDLDATADLSAAAGVSDDGDPVAITAYAQWAADPGLSIAVEEDVATVAGEAAILEPQVVDADEEAFDGDVTWSIREVGEALTVGVEPQTGRTTVSATQAGVFAFTLVADTPFGEITAPVTVTVEPAGLAELVLSASASTVTAGETSALTVTGADEFGNDLGDVTEDVTFTLTGTQGTIDGATVTWRTAGAQTVTATDPPTGVSDTIGITVVPAELAELELNASGTSVDEGGSITLAATGADEFGNDLGSVTAETEFASDVPTDIVEGNRITFPTASPHLITGTHQPTGVTATITIEVTPAQNGGGDGGGDDDGDGDDGSGDGSGGDGAGGGDGTGPASGGPGSGGGSLGSGDGSSADAGSGRALPGTGATAGPLLLTAAIALLGAGIVLIAFRRRPGPH